jgi:hypothetical protein
MSKDQKPKEKAQTADDILASLMDDLKDVDKATSDESLGNDLGLDLDLLKDFGAPSKTHDDLILLDDDESLSIDGDDKAENIDNGELNIDFDGGEVPDGLGAAEGLFGSTSASNQNQNAFDALESPVSAKELFDDAPAEVEVAQLNSEMPSVPEVNSGGPSLFGDSPVPSDDEQTAATEELSPEEAQPQSDYSNVDAGDGEKTVAVAGFSQRSNEDYGDKVKVSVGQVRGAASSGYAAWGSADSNLAQAENLRIAQEKILELEKENEKLRSQSEELIAASEIVKERADLLTGQLHEFKSDRDSLEQAFKNENSVLKSQLMRKDAEIVKASMKIEELESRMKFDLKKIRVRERELENRLELVRAEKNALVKTKDEQILDLRRKMDQVQLEVESYRQKCVELNKVIDTNQESFKRTTRALRLAMANLELQEENKPPLKKVD